MNDRFLKGLFRFRFFVVVFITKRSFFLNENVNIPRYILLNNLIFMVLKKRLSLEQYQIHIRLFKRNIFTPQLHDKK